jgi:hypothetical protein
MRTPSKESELTGRSRSHSARSPQFHENTKASQIRLNTPEQGTIQHKNYVRSKELIDLEANNDGYYHPNSFYVPGKQLAFSGEARRIIRWPFGDITNNVKNNHQQRNTRRNDWSQNGTYSPNLGSKVPNFRSQSPRSQRQQPTSPQETNRPCSPSLPSASAKNIYNGSSQQQTDQRLSSIPNREIFRRDSQNVIVQQQEPHRTPPRGATRDFEPCRTAEPFIVGGGRRAAVSTYYVEQE